MLYLVLAIFSSAMVSIVMRLSTNKVSGDVSMLTVNYLTCLTLGALYTGVDKLIPAVSGLPEAVGMGAVNGVLYLLGFVLFQFNVKKNGVVLSATFMKLGLLVPMVVSVCLFGEIPGIPQIIGFCIAVAAIILINFEKGASARGFGFGLILLLLAGGGGDAMSKVFEELGSDALSEQFLLYTFVTAFLLALALAVWKKEKLGMAEALFGMLIGIPNFLSARFLLKALEELDAVLVYPTYSVATLLVVTLTGVVFFRERLRKQQWAALAAILAALVLLNI